MHIIKFDIFFEVCLPLFNFEKKPGKNQMLKQIILPAFAALIIAGCASTNNISQDEFFNLPVLKSNLEFLASDELEGREAATHGAKVASKFIASELQKYGVEPFGDDGTYF